MCAHLQQTLARFEQVKAPQAAQVRSQLADLEKLEKQTFREEAKRVQFYKDRSGLFPEGII